MFANDFHDKRIIILSINVISEGMAKKAQESFLKTAGYKTYQGYLFDKPERINHFKKN
jgi:EAL domain-containing protein (putative c-di-GMP-specific phosphodiesterase class I)